MVYKWDFIALTQNGTYLELILKALYFLTFPLAWPWYFSWPLNFDLSTCMTLISFLLPNIIFHCVYNLIIIENKVVLFYPHQTLLEVDPKWKKPAHSNHKSIQLKKSFILFKTNLNIIKISCRWMQKISTIDLSFFYYVFLWMIHLRC